MPSKLFCVNSLTRFAQNLATKCYKKFLRHFFQKVAIPNLCNFSRKRTRKFFFVTFFQKVAKPFLSNINKKHPTEIRWGCRYKRLSGEEGALCRHHALRQHIFNKDTVTGSGVIDKHVGYCADELSVLNYWRATHTLNDSARC